jgi:hypothetical protein
MILQSANNDVIYHLLNTQEATIYNVGALRISTSNNDRTTPLHTTPLYLKSENTDFEIIPQIKFKGNQLFISTFSSLKEAGNYVLKTKNEPIAKLSYNFDRRESDLQSYSQSELERLIERQNLSGFSVLKDNFISMDNSLLAIDTKIAWWKWCLLLALIFLLAEVFILRLF